jgi:hypothetical protein
MRRILVREDFNRMLKDLNQESQAPEKCSGCGAPIRDR